MSHHAGVFVTQQQRSSWQGALAALVGAWSFLAGGQNAWAGDYLVHAGKLLDVRSGKIRSEMTIVIHADSITAVQSGYLAAQAGQEVIDLRAYTVLPGFIDCHVHLANELAPTSRADGFYMAMADFGFRAQRAGRVTLEAGFTTVRDLGDRSGAVLSLRNAIGKGWVVGPRIFAAGRTIASTGGHGDPSSGLSPGWMALVGPQDGVINSADEARAAIRARYKDGSDLIKITATGGVLSHGRSGDNAQFTAQELDAIIATAKDYNFSVAAHAHGREGMLRAIRAGVNSIEHGSAMDLELARDMQKRRIYLVPTLSAGVTVSSKADDPNFLMPNVRAKALAIAPKMANALKMAYRAGVPIAFGTDAGVGVHGENAKEFGYMVNAGMPPLAAIQSATIHAAALLRQSERLGALEVGKAADVIAVQGDPLQTIQTLEKVLFVMKDGQVIKRP